MIANPDQHSMHVYQHTLNLLISNLTGISTMLELLRGLLSHAEQLFATTLAVRPTSLASLMCWTLLAVELRPSGRRLLCHCWSASPQL